MSTYPDELPAADLAKLRGLIEAAFDVLGVKWTSDMVDVMVDRFDDVVHDEKGWGR